jgi:CAAX prenyl protease-like protein
MKGSPRRGALVRAAPFVVFVALLAVRGAWPADHPLDARWLYGASVLLAGALLVAWRREYLELHAPLVPSLPEAMLAIAVGLGVFVLWITLDAPWMRLGEPSAGFRPLGADGAIDWPLVATRAAGAVLLVPVMEELFWRSLLMRWIEGTPFEQVDARRVGARAVVLSTLVFVLAHTLWLAAAVAGLAYAWLYVRSGKLWLAVIAHAVTNGALAAWVVMARRWEFW